MPASVMKLDPTTGWIEVAGTRAEANAQEVRRQILDYIDQVGEALQASIAEHVEASTASIGQALKSLVADGSVVRKGQGRRNDPYLFSLPD